MALLNVPQVAELLGVSESWVRQRTSKGEIKHVRLGNNIRYRAQDVEDYIASHLSGADEAQGGN